MTMEELRKMASQISPLDGKPVEYVYLTVPIKRLPRGDTIRLLGKKGGPKGKICTVREGETPKTYLCVATFKAADLIAMCDTAESEAV